MKKQTFNEEVNRMKNMMKKMTNENFDNRFENDHMDDSPIETTEPEDDGEYMTVDGKKHPSHHGSPFDRGTSDSYYGRPPKPHKGGVSSDFEPENTDLSDDEIDSYHAGYSWNEKMGDKKDWGGDNDEDENY